MRLITTIDILERLPNVETFGGYQKYQWITDSLYLPYTFTNQPCCAAKSSNSVSILNGQIQCQLVIIQLCM